jgi:ATP-binding cassette subfamily B multidrug efflux pump
MLKLFRYLKPFRLLIGAVILLTIIQTASELILPALMAHIVDTGIVNRDMTGIVRSGMLMLAAAFIGAAGVVVASYVSALVSEGFGRSIRERIYVKVEELSLSSFQSLGASSLMTRTTNDVTQVQNVVQISLRVVLLAPLMCIGGVVMAVSQDARLSIVLLVTIPLLVLGVMLIVRKGMPLFKTVQRRIDRMNLVIREGISGVRVIRAFHRDGWQQERFNEANGAFRDISIQVNKIMSMNLPVILFAFNFSTVLILWFGTDRIVNKDIQVGELMAFVQYASMILLSIVLLSFLLGALPRAIASAARINELLEMASESLDNDAVQPMLLDSNEPLTMEYRDVAYRYPGAAGLALSHVSFSIRQGQVTAIVGKTGAGKTTLLNLLPRLLEPESGSILIGGIDIQSMPLRQLRLLMGVVPQKAVLFSGTILDNIRYGNPAAGEVEARQAADTAQATSFIEEMPEGYLSRVSQGGTNLSGGQQQRISIARTLARKPRIYLFDDSFSALDYKTDALLRKALRKELTDTVVLIVAQRIRTVMDADLIIVLDEGEMVAAGTHYELMNASDVYRNIVLSQQSGEETA